MKGVLTQIREAETEIAREIASDRRPQPSGYTRGYRDALMDVEAALRGHPNPASRYWPKPQGKQAHGR